MFIKFKSRILKRMLLFSIIFIILNISFVFAKDYQIDYTGDGIGDKTLTNIDNLQWKIKFATYGGENVTNNPKLQPTLTVSGDASYVLSVPDVSYFDSPSGGYKAGWSWAHSRNGKDGGSTCYDGEPCYYTFEHYMSDLEGISTTKEPIGAGTYKINMVAYGDAPSPPTIESSPGGFADRWNGYVCNSPVTCDFFDRCCEYFETQVSTCTSTLNYNGGTVSKCPVCKDSVNQCTEFDVNNGYFCNGVYAEIEFYDGTTLEYTSKSSDWNLSASDITYIRHEGFGIKDYTWITNTNSSKVNFTQTIYIFENCFTAADCPDPGVCLKPTCISDQCGEDFEIEGYADPGCPVATPYCNSTGNCVECTQDSNCPLDGPTGNYQCSGEFQIREERRDNFCDLGFNVCDYTDNWYNGTLCVFPLVCDLTGSAFCCTPYCGEETPYGCGDNDCGGSCGECPSERPVCNDNMCYDTGKAYWANMNGEKIGDGTSREHSEIGDTVLLIYQNMGAYVGAYNFAIYEDDGILPDNDIRTIPATQTFNYKGHLAAKWIINSSEFEKGTALGGIGGVEHELKFYFMVNGNQSNILNVNDSSTTPSDFPSVVIKEPILNSKVKVGNELNFTQIAKDDDDDLRIKWTFEDGDEGDWMLNCLTTGNCNTTHAYNGSGTKIIEIIAREMTRTQEAVNYSQVFAYAPGINVFAVITSPPFGKIYANDSAIQVPFNASTSYVANCTLDDCTAGPDCYDVGSDLHCYNLNKTTPADIPSKYNLDFNWTFSEGVRRTGRWSDDYDRVVEFDRLFYAPTQHWARLRVDYNPVS